MIDEINTEWEKSDRLTVAKLNTVKQFNKQDHKSKLMTEKYSLLPLNPQQLTPVQTAIQRMSEKHPDFEIESVNTIQPPEIQFTQTPQALVPIDTPLSIIHKHIPRQSDIDKIVKNIETHCKSLIWLPVSGGRWPFRVGSGGRHSAHQPYRPRLKLPTQSHMANDHILKFDILKFQFKAKFTVIHL